MTGAVATVAHDRQYEQLAPLRAFVAALTALVERTTDERILLDEGARLLGALIRAPRWLPASHAAPDAERYRQYLLHADRAGRFSVVSFVWGPGQATPIHDHTVWGLVGVLDGAELTERFAIDGGAFRKLGEERLGEGAIDRVSPGIGDLHRVSNARDNAASISIHVYGADIGTVARSTYDDAGRAKPFTSGYSPAPPLFL